MNETLKQLRDLGFAPHPTQKGVLVSAKFMRELTAAMTEGVADAVHDMEAGGPGSGRHPSGLVKWIDHPTKGVLSSSDLEHYELMDKHGISQNVYDRIPKGWAGYISGSKTLVITSFGNRMASNDVVNHFKSTYHPDKITYKNISDINAKGKPKPSYPSDHIAGMRVPKGGSSCASCEYLADNKKDCKNEFFQKWNGSPVIPGKIDEYCSDWFESKKDLQAGGPGSGRRKEYRMHKWINHPTKGILASPDLEHYELLDKHGISQNVYDRIQKGYARYDEGAKQLHITGIGDKVIPKEVEQHFIREYKLRGKVNVKYKQLDENTAAYGLAPDMLKAATENSQAGSKSGALWNGIKITGFTGPEETGLTAMMSRVPPELLTNVKEVKSAQELNAKHGRYIPETKVMLFNPKNFELRQRYGQGDGWMYHAETTVVHEIGHSIYENLPSDKQDEWMKIGGWMKGYKEGQSPAYIERRPGWEEFTSPMTHRQGLKLPRYYSEKSQHEAFADCFAFYMLGKQHQMEPAIKDYMQQLIKDKVKKYPQASIESPVRP